MQEDKLSHYHARMLRVLVYIDEHLEDDLSVGQLSAIAAFSKHHFHRQFGALYGISVYRYVQLLRLKRASFRLAFRRQDSVLQIALDSGFEGPEAFARAFKRHTTQTPSAFRERPQWEPWQAAYAPLIQTRSEYMPAHFTDEDVRLLDFPETAVAILDHWGDPAREGESIRKFIAWRKANGLRPDRSATFNILYHDPETTAAQDYRLGLCAATEQDIAPNDDGVGPSTIPAGRCAVLRLTGSSEKMRDATHFLYADWLPRSGHELRDFPMFAQRVRFFPDVPEHQAVTDIFLPLR
jgi:AraC family transcriptional regulator